MASSEFIRFIGELRSDPRMLAAYQRKNLVQLVFHARNAGFDFTEDEAVATVGALEINVIVSKDAEPVDGGSRLWEKMWSRPYLDYIVNHVAARYSDDELRSYGQDEQRAAV